MGNTTSNTTANESKSNDDTKLNQDECTHGYSDGEYTFSKSDLIENVHLKNEYNEALAGERPCSINPIGVIQDVYTVRTEPAKIADACNDCEIKTSESTTQELWKPTGTSDYAFDANYSNSCGTSDYTRDSDSNRCSNIGSNSDSNSDRGSERWQHRPEWRD